jgi:uncharacterized membrane protein affecting hemolysin expression
MAYYRIIVIYYLRLFIDLKQHKKVSVNIQQANIHLWVLEIVRAFALIVVDLLLQRRRGFKRDVTSPFASSL